MLLPRQQSFRVTLVFAPLHVKETVVGPQPAAAYSLMHQLP